MKTSFLYSIATVVAIFSFVGCSVKEQVEKLSPVDEEEGITVTLQASVDTDTKVAISGGNYVWQAGDKIGVFTDQGTTAEFSTTSETSSGTFTGILTAPQTSVASYAVCPYNHDDKAEYVAIDDDLVFYLSPTYDYTASNIHIPMLGKISGSNISFKAVGGGVRFNILNVPADAAKMVFSVEDIDIVGGFDVDASEATPVITNKVNVGSTDNSVTINFAENTYKKLSFFIPLPTGDIDGFSIVLAKANGTAIKTITSTKVLTIASNTIINAPTITIPVEDDVLWNETFSDLGSTSSTFSDNTPLSSYTNNAGTTGMSDATHDNATVSISSSSDDDVRITKSSGGNATSGHLWFNKNKTGYITTSDIYLFGATDLTFSFSQGGSSKVTAYYSDDSGSSWTKITDNSSAGKPISKSFKVDGGTESIIIKMERTSTNTNIRIDDLKLTAKSSSSATAPTITTTGNSHTVNLTVSGSLSRTINGVTLNNPFDPSDEVAVSVDDDWLDASLSGSVLTLTASGKNTETTDRSTKVYLKAPGAATYEITVTQATCKVANPSTLTPTPGDATFSISWSKDDKVKSYVGYYGTTTLANPASQGTALTITNVGSAYTATPSGAVSNNQEYHVYIQASAIEDAYVSNYELPTTFAHTTVTPVSASGADWELVSDFSSITSGDKYMFVATYSTNSKVYYMSSATVAVGGVSAFEITTLPTSSTFETTDNMWFILTGSVSSGFVASNKAGKTLQITNANDGLLIGDGDGTTLYFQSGDSGLTGTILTGNDNAKTPVQRYIGCYQGTDWRCYTSVHNNIKAHSYTWYHYIGN